MLFDNRRKMILGGVYVFWLLCVILASPAGFYILATSLVILYLLHDNLSKAQLLIAGLLIVLAATISMSINTEPIYNGELSNPGGFIFLLLLSVIALYFLDKKDEGSELPTVHHSSETDERHKLIALINSMADGVIATDQDKKATIYNGAALELLNLNVSLEGQELSKFLTLYDSQDKKVDIFKLAHKSRTSYATRDLVLKYADDDQINLYLSIAPVRVGYGQDSTLGYIILMRDITKEKSLEEERDEFISVVSHELRTPITVTEGSISNAQFVAKKEGASKSIESSLNEAHKSAVFLADMINDLSTLSRAERGKLQVEPESIDILALLESLRTDYDVQTKQKGLKLEVTKSDPIKPVNSAPLYVKEILQNFITNAIKYSEKGTIQLSAKHTDKGVDVMVKDTGIGISKSDQKKLFDKFFRSEDFRTRKNNGTGLGLYVTMKLAHLIGAQISVKSKLNEGSEFTISIPNLEAHHHRKRG